jgi:hypothetical protein
MPHRWTRTYDINIIILTFLNIFSPPQTSSNLQRGSLRAMLSSGAPVVHTSGVASVQMTNGSHRQRIYFIGGKSSKSSTTSTSKETNERQQQAPLDVLALDVDESLLSNNVDTFTVTGNGTGAGTGTGRLTRWVLSGCPQ